MHFKFELQILISSLILDLFCSVDDIILKSRSHKTIEGVKKNLCTPSFYTDKNGEREGKFIHEGELISILTVSWCNYFIKICYV